jgi:hypothetical protein
MNDWLLLVMKNSFRCTGCLMYQLMIYILQLNIILFVGYDQFKMNIIGTSN